MKENLITIPFVADKRLLIKSARNGLIVGVTFLGLGFSPEAAAIAGGTATITDGLLRPILEAQTRSDKRNSLQPPNNH